MRNITSLFIHVGALMYSFMYSKYAFILYNIFIENDQENTTVKILLFGLVIH